MKNVFLSIFAMLILNSCATKVSGLSKSDSFNYQNIKNGRIIIGGVVHSTESIDYKKMISLSNSLKNEILEERGSYKVTSAGVIGKRLGTDKYKAILSEFELDSELSSSSLSLLKQKLAGRRYIVFARVESDDIEKNRRNSEDTDSNGNETGGTTITTTASRDLVVSFKVFDLVEQNIAWSGTVKKRAQNQQKYKEESESGLVTLIKAFKGKEDKGLNKKYPYPEPPALNKVLSNAFNGFGENLPEEDS